MRWCSERMSDQEVEIPNLNDMKARSQIWIDLLRVRGLVQK